jgi:hypothetical protein
MLQIAMLVGVTAMVLGFTTDVQAECSGHFCTGRVDRLYTSSGANTVFVGTTGMETNLLCTPHESVYLTLSPTQPLFAQLYDSLLNAVTFRRPVIIRLPDSGSCQISYVVLEEVEGFTVSGSASREPLEDEEIPEGGRE